MIVDNKDSEKKLGTEPVLKLILSMGIPTFIAQLINMLYNIVDRIYIGHIPGSGADALTGVGLCLPIITFLSAFSYFAAAGGAPLASIELGKGDIKKAQKIMNNCIFLLVVFSFSLMIVFYIFKKPFLYSFGASDRTYPYADAYISIYLAGTIFVMMAMGLNMFITAQGRSKTAMISVLIGALLNICLDPLFIFVLNMGIRGAAIATIISQFASSLFVIIFLASKRSVLRINLSMMKPDFKQIGSIMALGISPFIMQATESLISIVFNSGMLKYGNDLYVGSITIMQSVLQLILVPMSGFSQGVQPVISYNYGAGNYERVKKTCTILITITTVSSLILSLVAICFPGTAAGIFTTDKELIEICRRMMPIFLAGITIFGLQCGCQQSFLALGQAKKSLFFALFRKVILLIPLALILPAVTNSVIGIYISEPISDAVSAVTCILTFLLSFNKIMTGNPGHK